MHTSRSKKRRSRSRSRSKHKKHKQEQHRHSSFEGNNEALKKLISVFNEIEKNKEWMVPLNESFTTKVNGEMSGQTFIVNGPAQAGKTSLVYWALRHDGG